MENSNISNAAETFLSIDKHRIFINNKWVDAETHETISIINPANESEIGKISVASSSDVSIAIDAAQTA